MAQKTCEDWWAVGCVVDKETNYITGNQVKVTIITAMRLTCVACHIINLTTFFVRHEQIYIVRNNFKIKSTQKTYFSSVKEYYYY